jgi:hypothetical protein
VAAGGVAAVLFALVGACGIPEESEVYVAGRGPVSDAGSSRGTVRQPPRREDSGDDPERFAVNFLAAAAGEAAEAYKRVNDYIVADRRLKDKPANEVAINIVRLIEETPLVTLNGDGTSSVSVKVQQVGVLRANGSVGKPVATETSYTFKVGKQSLGVDRLAPGAGLHVLEPPPVLLMSTDALETYYETKTIYFWNTDRDALIPDLRYLPKVVPVERQATEMLGWLTGGPAEWLAPTAVRLPEGTTVLGNVPAPADGGRVEINLSVKAGEVDSEAEVDRLFLQLAWSLRDYPLLKGELELKIQNQSRRVADAADYRAANQIYEITEVPERYAVYTGRLYPLIGSGGTGSVRIADEVNRDIVAADLIRWAGTDRAALVTTAREGRRLAVGAGPGDDRPIGDFHTSRPYPTMGRPVWLRSADPETPLGLVLIDGRLHRFTEAADPVEVRLPETAEKITDFGVSLDGHRLALIAGGQLYVAPLSVDGEAVVVGGFRRLAISLRQLTAVDWTGENTLAVAGSNAADRVTIVQLNVDGARESPLIQGVGARITHLATYPDNPVFPVTTGNLLYEANEVAYATGTPIDVDDVVRPVEPEAAEPEGNPVAPFFRY